MIDSASGPDHALIKAMFGEAVHDSPGFKRELRDLENDFEEYLRRQDAAVRAVRGYFEEDARLQELLPRLSEALQRVAEVGGAQPLGGFACVVSCFYGMSSRLLKEKSSRLLVPLIDARQAEVARVRESKKALDKASDRFEHVQAKHAAGLTRMRSGPSLIEPPTVSGSGTFEALQEARRQYFSSLGEHLGLLLEFRSNSALYWTEKVSWLLSTETAVVSEMARLLRGIDSGALSALANGQVDAKVKTSETLRSELSRFMDRVRQEHDPKAAIGLRVDQKQGYLFRKRTRGIGPPWKRLFAAIDSGVFRYWPDPSAQSIDTNVLLCQIKLYETVERSCCFEVATPQKTLVFQAETEDDLMDWLRVFENAKNQAMTLPLSGPTADAGAPKAGATDSAIGGVRERLGFLDGYSSVLASCTEKLVADGVIDKGDTVFLTCPDAAAMNGRLGSLVCTRKCLLFQRLNIAGAGAWKPVKWADIESARLVGGDDHVFSSLSMQLAGGPVDAPDTESTLELALYCKGHQETIDLVLAMSRLLSGPSVTDQQVIDIVLRSDAGEEQHQQSPPVSGAAAVADTFDVFPEGFEYPLAEIAVHDPEPGSDLEAKELSVVLPLTARALFEIMFNDPEGRLLKSLHKRRKSRDLRLGEWQETDGARSREVEYMVPLNNPILKVRETRCIEQLRVREAVDYQLYTVDVRAKTPDAPYGDAFFTRSRYSITFVSVGSCRLSVWFGMRWERSVLLKSVIRSAAKSGFDSYLADLLLVVKLEVKQRLKMKSRVAGPLSKSASESTVKSRGSKAEEEEWERQLETPAAVTSDGQMSSLSAWLPRILVTLALLSIAALFLTRSPRSGGTAPTMHPDFKAPSRERGTKALIARLQRQLERAEERETALGYAVWLRSVIDQCRKEESNARTQRCSLAVLEWRRLVQSG